MSSTISAPAMATGMLSAVQSAHSGVASGALNAVRQMGGAVGVAVFGTLMATDMVWGMRMAPCALRAAPARCRDRQFHQPPGSAKTKCPLLVP